MLKIIRTIFLMISISAFGLYLYNIITIKVNNVLVSDNINNTLNSYLTVGVFCFLIYFVIYILCYFFRKRVVSNNNFETSNIHSDYNEEVYVSNKYSIGTFSEDAIKLIIILAIIAFLLYKMYLMRYGIQ